MTDTTLVPPRQGEPYTEDELLRDIFGPPSQCFGCDEGLTGESPATILAGGMGWHSEKCLTQYLRRFSHEMHSGRDYFEARVHELEAKLKPLLKAEGQ